MSEGPSTSGAASPVQRWTRLSWVGDVDCVSVESLTMSLRDSCDREDDLLEIDLSQVTFMDCAGLGPLLSAQARRSGQVRLYAPAPPVTRLLNLLGLSHVFEIVGPVGVTSWSTPGPTPTEFARAGVDDDEPAVTLPRALSDRATIEQAKGLLMARGRCDAATAWQLLRELAETNEVRIGVMATTLLDDATRHPRTSRPQESTGPTPPLTAEAADVHAEFLRSRH